MLETKRYLLRTLYTLVLVFLGFIFFVPLKTDLYKPNCLSSFSERRKKKLAMSGNYDAVKDLFDHYLVCRQDVNTALKWMEISANQGNVDAQFTFAYWNKLRDKNKACKWF